MSSPVLSQGRAVIASGAGVLRKGRRTKDLIKRLHPGDIALICHADLDVIAARALCDARVAAVIDCLCPASGRYPNKGPQTLNAARIPLVQLVEPDAFDQLADNAHVAITPDGTVKQRGKSYAATFWDIGRIDAAEQAGRDNLGRELEKFASNTLEYVRKEKDLIIEPVELPPLVGLKPMKGRHAVVVVRGEGYREDLASISGYIGDVKPVLIGVDGGADALLECGLKPDIIIGDMDSVSDRALSCGALLIVHAYSESGHAPGLERLQKMGVAGASETFRVAGTSEDAALLLAYEKGSELIVAVGTHSNLEDFLNKGRAGMASTFLVRLKVGARLVDARGVSQLHQRRASLMELIALLLSAVFVVVVLVIRSPMWTLVYRILHLQSRLSWMHFLRTITHHG
jgi:uncharacterized membrane-anchored protein